MKWTIAICTVPIREGQLKRLVASLMDQIGGSFVRDIVRREEPGVIRLKAVDDRKIEILIAGQNLPLSRKRQWCLDNARGEYFCFIDDDDLVAENYVDAIYPLLDGVDYIGFRVQLYVNGITQKPTFHSLRYDVWSDDDNGYYRNISHLNPIRTEIARQGTYSGGYGEDRRWAEQVRPVTEHYVPEVMYHYCFNAATSLTCG